MDHCLHVKIQYYNTRNQYGKTRWRIAEIIFTFQLTKQIKGEWIFLFTLYNITIRLFSPTSNCSVKAADDITEGNCTLPDTDAYDNGSHTVTNSSCFVDISLWNAILLPSDSVVLSIEQTAGILQSKFCN